MEYLQVIATLLVAKLPVLASIGSNALAICLAAGLLIELAEVAAAMTASGKDDAAVAKIKTIKNKVIAVLELFPHANIPVAPVIIKVTAIVAKVAKAAMAAIKAIKD